jgi:hypothetical protein
VSRIVVFIVLAPFYLVNSAIQLGVKEGKRGKKDLALRLKIGVFFKLKGII